MRAEVQANGQRFCSRQTGRAFVGSEISSWRRQMAHALRGTRLVSWMGICGLGLAMWIASSAGALAQSSPSAEARLKELSITLPAVPPPVANYVHAVRVG